MNQENKNTAEIAVFWAQSQPAIAAFIYSLVPVPQDADDILQDVAVITVDKFEEYDRNKSFTAWAIGIAKNMVLRHYSKKSSKRSILDQEAIEKVAHVYEADLKSIHDMKSSMEAALNKCLTLLKGRRKQIFEMHYLYEFTPARIAQHLSITRNNVYRLLHRLRLSLKDCVNQRVQHQNR